MRSALDAAYWDAMERWRVGLEDLTAARYEPEVQYRKVRDVVVAAEAEARLLVRLMSQMPAQEVAK